MTTCPLASSFPRLAVQAFQPVLADFGFTGFNDARQPVARRTAGRFTTMVRRAHASASTGRAHSSSRRSIETFGRRKRSRQGHGIPSPCSTRRSAGRHGLSAVPRWVTRFFVGQDRSRSVVLLGALATSLPESQRRVTSNARARGFDPCGALLRTLIRTLNPVGAHRNWPEPTVTTVLSRSPPDVCRDSGMRYQVSSRRANSCSNRAGFRLGGRTRAPSSSPFYALASIGPGRAGA